MKKLKSARTLLALLVVFTLCLSLLPAMAFASGRYPDDNYDTIGLLPENPSRFGELYNNYGTIEDSWGGSFNNEGTIDHLWGTSRLTPPKV